MVQNPPAHMPRISPYLYYDQPAAALEWLEQTFGLSRRFELPGPDGKLMHAELMLDDGVVMMGPTCAEENSRSPAQLTGVHQSLYVYVDDVDAHCEHARHHGARIIMEPTDMFWGDRMYSVKDIEGHHWTFAQHVRDVPPDQLRPDGV